MTDETSKTDDIKAEIEQTRSDLADSVDALAAKADVKARGKEQLAHAKESAADALDRAKQSAPEPVQQALDKAASTVGPAAAKARDTAAPYRKQILIGVGVLFVLLVLRGRRHSDHSGDE